MSTSVYNIERQPEIAIWPPKPEVVIPMVTNDISLVAVWYFVTLRCICSRDNSSDDKSNNHPMIITLVWSYSVTSLRIVSLYCLFYSNWVTFGVNYQMFGCERIGRIRRYWLFYHICLYNKSELYGSSNNTCDTVRLRVYICCFHCFIMYYQNWCWSCQYWVVSPSHITQQNKEWPHRLVVSA